MKIQATKTQQLRAGDQFDISVRLWLSANKRFMRRPSPRTTYAANKLRGMRAAAAIFGEE